MNDQTKKLYHGMILVAKCLFGFFSLMTLMVAAIVIRKAGWSWGAVGFGLLSLPGLYVSFKLLHNLIFPEYAIRMFHHPDYPHLQFSIGKPKAFLGSFFVEYFSQERITHSTIQYGDGTIYAVKAPGRHHHLINTRQGQGLPTFDYEQGFLTSRGRYVNREEACIIARAANQIIKKTGGDKELYSECVWNTPLEHQYKPPKE